MRFAHIHTHESHLRGEEYSIICSAVGEKVVDSIAQPLARNNNRAQSASIERLETVVCAGKGTDI